MIGYKVVRESVSGYRPATVWALQSVRYKLGDATVRDPKKQGPLAVFASCADAAQFIRFDLSNHYSLHILKVDYTTKKSTEKKLWKRFRVNAAYRERNAWRDKIINKIKALVWRRTIPEGTVFAESVTPLEIIPRTPRRIGEV